MILAVISDHLEDGTRCPTKTRSGRNITRSSEIDFSIFERACYSFQGHAIAICVSGQNYK